MVIDVHVHHCLGPESESAHRRLDMLLASADRAGIDSLCLLGNVLRFGVRPDPQQVRRINSRTLELAGHASGRLRGFCYLNPEHGAASVGAEVDRCVVKGGMAGIKLEIDVNARDRRLAPIMRMAADLRVPVMQHAWYKTVGAYPHESDPSDVAFLAHRFPETTIIMAHLTGAGMWGILDIAECLNVYVDTSGSQPVAGMVEYAVAKLGAERVLFGSDVCCRDFACQLGRVTGAALTRREKSLVLGGNASRLLGIG